MGWRMRTGGALVALAVTFTAPSFVRAQPLATDEVDYSAPAGVLVMPFDVTAGRVSFQIVSRIGASFGGDPVRTHWVFWSADCRHLADVFISLTDRDTVVVDPTRLQGQIQTTNPPENHPQGPPVDLSGEKGIVTVTAIHPQGGITPQLVGGWTIANPATALSFGGDAIGVSRNGSLPDAAILDGGITIPTFNPQTLTSSDVILIGLESDGSGVRPITRASDDLGGAHVCCAASITDNLESTLSVPDVCFACATFMAITPELAAAGESTLIPPGSSLGSSGFVQLAGCVSADTDGSIVPVGTGDAAQFVVALHGQSVGPFGFVVTGKYSGFRDPI